MMISVNIPSYLEEDYHFVIDKLGLSPSSMFQKLLRNALDDTGITHARMEGYPEEYTLQCIGKFVTHLTRVSFEERAKAIEDNLSNN